MARSSCGERFEMPRSNTNDCRQARRNVFMAKDGVVYTPAANGTFLNGITRQRVIKLLREDGVSVIEKTMRYAEFQTADDLFDRKLRQALTGYARR